MQPLRWLWILVFVLLTGACRTALPPSADDLSPLALDTAPGMAFVSPVVKGSVTGDLKEIALEIQIFAVDAGGRSAYGEALGPTFSTASGGGIEINSDQQYQANWKVSDTVNHHPDVAYVRVEVRLANATDGPACNQGAILDCLGFFDARLVAKKGQNNSPPGFIELTHTQTLPIKFFVAEQDANPGPAPETLAGLVTLSGKIVGQDTAFDESLGNCSTNEFDTPGQRLSVSGARLSVSGARLSVSGARLSISGAIGGLFILEPASGGEGEGDVIDVAPPGKVAEQLLNIQGLGNPSQKVAIIVADDFDGVYALPENLFSAAGVVDLERLEQLEKDGKLTHGVIVFHHMLGLVAGAGYSKGSAGERFVKFKKGGSGPSLGVQAVDTAGFNTDIIANNIQTEVARLKELGYHRIVVNMSFVIIPCAVQDDFTASSSSIEAIETFEDYVKALAEVNNIAAEYLGDLEELVTTPLKLENEPLFEYLDSPGPGIVNVASAGNFGNQFPFYPAAWPTVIGISSQNILEGGFSPQKSWFSNSGEIMVPGALFELGSNVAYAGTSFSAPVAALFTALDLAQFEPRCDPGGLDDSGRFLPPALAHGDENAYNLPLDSVFGKVGSAVATFCKLPQTITFTMVPDSLILGGAQQISATGGGSGKPVVFSSLTKNSCEISGASTVTAIGVGQCTIEARQDGDNDYAAANPITHSFNVGYNFGGFFSPVNNDELNIVKAGQTVPLKFRVTDANGQPIITLSNVSVTTVGFTCPSGSSADNEVTEYASGASALQHDGNGNYQYNWQTPKSFAGSCRAMHLDLGEGFTRTASFRFTR